MARNIVKGRFPSFGSVLLPVRVISANKVEKMCTFEEKKFKSEISGESEEGARRERAGVDEREVKMMGDPRRPSEAEVDDHARKPLPVP